MLEFKKIYDGYVACNDGTIWSNKSNRELKCRDDKNGYYRFNIIFKGNHTTLMMHQVICKAFKENPDNKPQINHVDGNKKNNHIDNLEWCTCKENIRHAYDSGLCDKTKYGNHHLSKLKPEDVLYIKRELKSKEKSLAELARMFNVSSHSIYCIKVGKSYRYINEV